MSGKLKQRACDASQPFRDSEIRFRLLGPVEAGDLRDRLDWLLGAAYGTHEDKLRPIGGLNYGFTEQVSALIIFDGVNVHPTVTWTGGRHAITVLVVEAKHLGLSYSVSFSTPRL